MAARTGFIGLGIMGEGMARNLVKGASKKLLVWNRSADKCAALQAEFGTDVVQVASSAREVVEGCDVTFSMLSTPEASAAVMSGADGALAGLGPGKALVDCATLTADDMRRTAAAAAAAGAGFLEAPVSGSKGPAAAGELIFLCGGDAGLFEKVAPELDAMGKKSVLLGAVGKGTEMKLVVNMTMGTMMGALSEGLALAEAADLPTGELLSVLDLGAMSNPMFRMKGPKMAARPVSDHAPNFPLKHAQKDMRFALALGDSLGQPLPAASATNQAMVAARALGRGDEDFSATIEGIRAPKKSKN